VRIVVKCHAACTTKNSRESGGVGIIELIGALPCLLEHRESLGDAALRVKSFAVVRGGLAPMRSVGDRHEAPGCLQHLVGAHRAGRPVEPAPPRC